MELLKNEKGSKDDGLVHRFLINAPKPVFHLAEDMMLAPELNCSLRTILYLIYKNNLTESNIMRLSDDAALQFSFYFDQNRKMIEASYNKKTDTFIR